MRKRLTIKNPNGSFRIPMCNAESFRMEWQQETLAIFGNVVDRLGEYEELGTPQELAALKGMYNRTKK